jgi:hypothetical protein
VGKNPSTDVNTVQLFNTDRMKFATDTAVSFITFFHILLVPFFITVYMAVCFVCFCLIL